MDQAVFKTPECCVLDAREGCGKRSIVYLSGTYILI